MALQEYKLAGGSPDGLAYAKETFLNICIKVLCLHIAGVPVEVPQREQTLALLKGTHVSFPLLAKATSVRHILKKVYFSRVWFNSFSKCMLLVNQRLQEVATIEIYIGFLLLYLLLHYFLCNSAYFILA